MYSIPLRMQCVRVLLHHPPECSDNGNWCRGPLTRFRFRSGSGFGYWPLSCPVAYRLRYISCHLIHLAHTASEIHTSTIQPIYASMRAPAP